MFVSITGTRGDLLRRIMHGVGGLTHSIEQDKMPQKKFFRLYSRI